MVVVNFDLRGDLENKVKRYIKKGYASSKAEVMRIALSNLREPGTEDISDDPELMEYLLAVKKGKIKPRFVGSNSDLKKLLS